MLAPDRHPIDDWLKERWRTEVYPAVDAAAPFDLFWEGALRTGVVRTGSPAASALLAGIPGTRIPWPKLPELATPYVFPLWVDEPAKSYQKVRQAGVPIFRWDDAWPDVPAIAGDHGPQWANHIFQLGCHQDLSVDDLGVMADTLRRIFLSEAP